MKNPIHSIKIKTKEPNKINEYLHFYNLYHKTADIMNFLLHRQKTPGRVLQMPSGIEELMADISREVLRYQPSKECIYKFIADYLEAMLNTREKSKIAMEVIEEAILKTDEVYDEFVKCNIPRKKTDKFLDMMEITFRRFVDQKRRLMQDPNIIKFHSDDMMDELMRKCDLTRVEVLRSRPAIQWAYKKFVKTYLAAVEGTLDTEGLYLETENLVASSKELQKLNASAVKIQKVYRGYNVRKQIQEHRNLATTEGSAVGSLTSYKIYDAQEQDELTKAAVKIQATYKGFQVRIKLPLKSVPNPVPVTIPTTTIFEDLENAENLEDFTKAAIAIQATFKGHLVRKEMNKSIRGELNN